MSFILTKKTQGLVRHYFTGEVTDTVDGILYALGDLPTYLTDRADLPPFCAETSLSSRDSYRFHTEDGANYWANWLNSNGIGGALWEICDLRNWSANSNTPQSA